MPISENETPSTRPYLIRALHDWCTENGFSPYIAVQVDESVRVPMEHVRNGEIVLNVSLDATSGMKLGNDCIEFRARFGGVSREIIIPVDHVIAIYARENGQGMAFPAPLPAVTRGGDVKASTAAPMLESVPSVQPESTPSGPAMGGLPVLAGESAPDTPPDLPPRSGGRGHLTRVK